MCCPPLLVISSHCDMRTIRGGNGKDSKKDGLAIVGRAGGRMYRRGSWLSTGSLEVRFERLRKLVLKDILSFPGPPAYGTSLCHCLREVPKCGADEWGSPAFLQGVFHQRLPFREDLHSGSMGMGDISGTSKMG